MANIIVSADCSNLTLFVNDLYNVWLVNSIQIIAWDFPDVLSNVKIELSRNNGNSWEIVTSSTPNDGIFSWTVTSPGTNQALIKISGLIYTDPVDGSQIDFTDIVDVSNDVFEIIQPINVNITSPVDLNLSVLDISLSQIINTIPIDLNLSVLNNILVWAIDSIQDITWDFPDVLSNVKIELSRDNGTSWEIITSSTPNDGIYQWTVTDPVTSLGLIRISGLIYTDPIDGSQIDFTDIVDVSDQNFYIINSNIINNTEYPSVIDLNLAINDNEIQTSQILVPSVIDLNIVNSNVDIMTVRSIVVSVDTINIISNIVTFNIIEGIGYIEYSDVVNINLTNNDNQIHTSQILYQNVIDNTLSINDAVIVEGYGNLQDVLTINISSTVIDSVITGNTLVDLNSLNITFDILNSIINCSNTIYTNINNLNINIYEPDVFVKGNVIVYINVINMNTYAAPNGLQVIMKLDGPGNFTHIYNISNSADINNILSAVPNSVLLSGTINDLNYIETVYHVSGTELDLIAPPYEKIHTSLFGDFATGYGMGNGTNMVNGWITKCDDSQFYNNERKLFDNLITEAYNLHGVCMDYYITSYNKNYDKVWGEDNNRYFERKFPVNVYYMLPREEKMWSKFGIQGRDSFSMYISKLHFRDASTVGMNEVAGDIGQGTYDSYIPQIGDIIRSEYNNYIYEIVEVKEEIGMFLLSKQHIWELMVKTYKDEHISLSATTLAGMAEISAVTNKSSDVLNISSVIDTKKVPVKYVPKAGEKTSNDYMGGW